MKSFPILYARNSNGKINQWATGAQDDGKVVIWEGLINSESPTRTERQSNGKNIGKMNETTAYEQACKDAESRWNDKRKKGYKSIDDLMSDKDKLSFKEVPLTSDGLVAYIEFNLPMVRTDANDLSKPMKAQPYFKDDGTPRITFPCYGQPKLNGFRVMARWETVEEGEGIFRQPIEKVVFRSKEGLRFTVLEHIEKEFTDAMFKLDGKSIAYDGEMYIPGEILSEISSAVKKKNPKTELIKFFIFDVAIEGETQTKRINMIEKLKEYIYESGRKNIIVVSTVVIRDNDEAQGFTNQAIVEGYEGGIFRDMKAHYQFGSRPKTMVKLKRSQDKEFEVVDVIGGENAPDLGIFVCKAENGELFKVNPEGTHELRKEYLKNRTSFIGNFLTVKFFERTKTGVPFHATGIAIRNYE